MATVKLRMPRRPRLSERVEQQHGVQLLRSIGGRVYVSGTTRRRGDYHGTMQTPGIPDVEAFLPPPAHSSSVEWRLLKWECKADGGRLRPEQLEYREICARAQVAHVVGTFDALIAWLMTAGYLKPDQVAAHHVRA